MTDQRRREKNRYPRQPLLNTDITNLSMEGMLEAVMDHLHEGRQGYLVAVNVDVIMKLERDPELAAITREADLVAVDGKPLLWIARHYRHPVREKVSGSDLVPLLMPRLAAEGRSVFLLGGREGVPELAAKNLLARYPGLVVAGTLSPPLGFEQKEAELTRITEAVNAARPDVLLVCFGCPKQEKWVGRHLRETNAGFAICAGATVDFLAGTVSRAPRWMSEHGLEWFYRFLKEPRRLFHRYFIEDVQILPLIRKYERRCR